MGKFQKQRNSLQVKKSTDSADLDMLIAILKKDIHKFRFLKIHIYSIQIMSIVK